MTSWNPWRHYSSPRFWVKGGGCGQKLCPPLTPLAKNHNLWEYPQYTTHDVFNQFLIRVHLCDEKMLTWFFAKVIETKGIIMPTSIFGKRKQVNVPPPHSEWPLNWTGFLNGLGLVCFQLLPPCRSSPTMGPFCSDSAGHFLTLKILSSFAGTYQTTMSASGGMHLRCQILACDVKMNFQAFRLSGFRTFRLGSSDSICGH